jgi:hypothetical protein
VFTWSLERHCMRVAVTRSLSAVLNAFPTPSCILFKLKHSWNIHQTFILLIWSFKYPLWQCVTAAVSLTLIILNAAWKTLQYIACIRKKHYNILQYFNTPLQVENKLTYNECKQYGLYIIVLFVETPRKFITAKKTKQKKTKNKQTKKLNKTIIFKVCSLKLLYVLSPCKHTKNLVRPIFYLLRACSYGQKLSRLARKLFDKLTSEISPCYENNMKSYIAFIWDEKFSGVPRSRLLTGEISVTGIMFSPYEHNFPA